MTTANAFVAFDEDVPGLYYDGATVGEDISYQSGTGTWTLSPQISVSKRPMTIVSYFRDWILGENTYTVHNTLKPKEFTSANAFKGWLDSVDPTEWGPLSALMATKGIYLATKDILGTPLSGLVVAIIPNGQAPVYASANQDVINAANQNAPSDILINHNGTITQIARMLVLAPALAKDETSYIDIEIATANALPDWATVFDQWSTHADSIATNHVGNLAPFYRNQLFEKLGITSVQWGDGPVWPTEAKDTVNGRYTVYDAMTKQTTLNIQNAKSEMYEGRLLMSGEPTMGMEGTTLRLAGNWSVFKLLSRLTQFIDFDNLDAPELDEYKINVERVRISAQLDVMNVLSEIESLLDGKKTVKLLLLLSILTPHGAFGVFMKDYAAYRTITLSSKTHTRKWRLTDLVVALNKQPDIDAHMGNMMGCVPTLNLYFRGAVRFGGHWPEDWMVRWKVEARWPWSGGMLELNESARKAIKRRQSNADTYLSTHIEELKGYVPTMINFKAVRFE